MKLVKQSQAKKVQTGEKCQVLEYPLGDKDIDMAIGTPIVRLQCLVHLLGIKSNITW